MKIRRSIPSAILLLLAGSVAGVHASDVTNKMEAYVVQQDAEGNEIFLPAEEANPGATMEYRMFFSNIGNKAKRDLAITGPIPADTKYIASSAHTETRSDLLVSIDGGDKWEPEPVVRMRLNDAGEEEEYIVSSEQYTHLRWYAKQRLAAKQTQVYMYRVKLKSVN